MTPKRKAKELVKKFHKGKDEHGWALCEFYSCAKQCALIAVDEIMKAIGWEEMELGVERDNYWDEVKQEIEKL